ncbi:hypothetical protein D9M71_828100 [compost metagenome]
MPPELRNGARQQGLPQAGAARQAQLAFAVLGKVVGHFVHALHVLVERRDLHEQPAGFRGGIEPALDALEQHQAQALLGIGDQPADRRLGHE